LQVELEPFSSIPSSFAQRDTIQAHLSEPGKRQVHFIAVVDSMDLDMMDLWEVDYLEFQHLSKNLGPQHRCWSKQVVASFTPQPVA